MSGSICGRYGWHENNEPVCAGCGWPIRIRGEEGVAVLPGEVLECRWEEGVWFAHFECRKADWWYANKTDRWWVRTMGSNRTYVLLTSRSESAEKEPQIAYCKEEA